MSYRTQLVKEVIESLETENAKLREELAKWEQLTAGIDLPEYPVTQFKPKDLERKNAKLERENAKLRELALVLRHCADGFGDCDACPVNGARPASHAWFGCDVLCEMMRSLGLEVEESDVSAGLRVEDAERTQ